MCGERRRYYSVKIGSTCCNGNACRHGGRVYRTAAAVAPAAAAAAAAAELKTDERVAPGTETLVLLRRCRRNVVHRRRNDRGLLLLL